MILFLSDIHFGRSAPADEQALERDLIAFLRSQEERVERLFLLGDVFDYYIEYANLVPRGFARFQGLLADWSDAGIDITYLVGNHDPWHDEYFEQELGVRVLQEAVTEPLGGRAVYLAHGDDVADSGGFHRLVRKMLRHPVPVWLYKRFLPGDIGIFLAREVSRAIRRRGDYVKQEAVDALRRHARHILRATPADSVVMGHTHKAELVRWDEGEYLNTGCWYRGRTFGRLDEDGLSLCQWDGAQVTPMAAVDASPSVT